MAHEVETPSEEAARRAAEERLSPAYRRLLIAVEEHEKCLIRLRRETDKLLQWRRILDDAQQCVLDEMAEERKAMGL